MAPELNEWGLLAPGIHDMTMAEIGEVFGNFQRSDRRMTLMARLRTFAEAVSSADKGIRILVDGSFIMKKVDEPGDIDVILMLPADWDEHADLPPFKYNVISKRMVRKLHGFDILVGIIGQESEAAVTRFFAQVNLKWLKVLGIPPGTTKGLVRLTA